MTKIERAFFWVGHREVTGGKRKLNWEAVCRPTHLGRIGILHIEKFARDIRLRWPWFEWRDPSKLWVGMDTPCNETDMGITIGWVWRDSTPLQPSLLGMGKLLLFGTPHGLMVQSPKTSLSSHFRGIHEKKMEGQGCIIWQQLD
jgi:hypothetical protein